MNCPNCKHNLPAKARFCSNCGTSFQRASTIDYSELITERTQDFTGREWLFHQLNQWLAHGSEPVFLLTGGPGSGKTAAMARLVQMSEGQVPAIDYPHLGQGSLAFFHFCQALDDRTLNPRRFVEVLSLALAHRYPLFAQALIQTPETSIVIQQKVGSVQSGGQVIGASIESLHIGTLSARVAFDRIVRRPLEQLCTAKFDETILILVDALDEALTYPDESILTLLSRRAGLPPQVRFVLTSRPNQRVLDVFGDPTLDLIDDAPDNQDDVAAYAHRRLHLLAEPKRMELARRIATAGAGNFLYARYVLDDLLADEKPDLEPATLSLPAGLDDIYRQFLQRQFPATSSDWKKHYRPLLGMLAVARGSGLTRSQLGGIMSIAHQLPQSQTDDFLQACAQYLSAPHPDGPFRIYHHSFRDFLLTDERYQIYPSEANQAIADFYYRKYKNDWLTYGDEYALRYLPSHLVDSVSGNDSQTLSMLSALANLLTNLDFLEAKTAQFGVDALLSDMHAALRVLTPQREPPSFGHRRRSGEESITAQQRGSFRNSPRTSKRQFLRPQSAPKSPQKRGESNETPFFSGNLGRRRRRRSFSTQISKGRLREVETIHRALDLESHYLRRWNWIENPAFFAQQMLNRITELGWESLRDYPQATARKRLIELQQPYLALRWRARQESPGLMRTLTGHTEAVNDVKITPDSRLAISASDDRTVKVWNLQTGQTVRTLAGHKRAVTAVAISHDGRLAASASKDGTLRLWDLQSWQPIHVIDGLLRREKNPIAITPDDYVIATCNDHTVRVWHLHTGQKIGTLANHRGRLTAIALSPDGPIISNDADLWTATLSIWDKQTRRFIDALGSHEGDIRDLAVIPDDELIVSASEDGTLKIWDQKTGIEVRTIRVWDPSETEKTLRGGDMRDWAHVVAVIANGNVIVSGSWERTLSIWDTHSGQLIDSLTGHEGGVNAVAATPNGHLVLSASDDKTLKLWNLREVIPNRQRLAGHTQWVNVVTVSPDGSHVISGSDDGTIKVWDRSTGKELHTFIGHDGWVLGLVCTPSFRHLISGSADRTLKIWDIETFQLVRTLTGHQDRVRGVAVTPHGHLISASDDHTLKVWDLQTGSELRTLGHEGSVHAVAVTSDGQVAISASWDHTLKVWSLKTGQEVCTLYGHKDRVDGIAITPDNRLAISASYDHTLIIWNLQTGQAIRTLTGHTDIVYKVAVTPNGQRAISVSGDHTLRVWDLQTGRELAKVALEGALGSITVIPEPLEIVVGDAIGNLYCLSYIETPERGGYGKQMNGPYL